ncbi:diphthine synthase, DPH2 subunit [Corchorus olitorius]|uniref:Diphthine synthase, DPH2 subunit n=1 Tax=Corchorus olitorius TaxID=93759 RepID=A0A1R3L1A4_9ROSI|nr:diphthine synthase, DPH2 subunit [Corchorus olitorius]
MTAERLRLSAAQGPITTGLFYLRPASPKKNARRGGRARKEAVIIRGAPEEDGHVLGAVTRLHIPARHRSVRAHKDALHRCQQWPRAAGFRDDLAHALLAVAELVDRKRFTKHGAHRLAGMQRAIRVLKHHLQHAAALDQRHVSHRSAVDEDIACPEIVEH